MPVNIPITFARPEANLSPKSAFGPRNFVALLQPSANASKAASPPISNKPVFIISKKVPTPSLRDENASFNFSPIPVNIFPGVLLINSNNSAICCFLSPGVPNNFCKNFLLPSASLFCNAFESSPNFLKPAFTSSDKSSSSALIVPSA